MDYASCSHTLLFRHREHAPCDHVVGEKVKSAGYAVDLYRVSDMTEPAAKKYSLHVFAYPVYALDIPNIMLQYMRKLPRDSARAAVITIFGELSAEHMMNGYEGNALARARKVLRKKGYDVFFTDAARYPHSITIGLNPPGSEDQQAIRARSDKKVEAMADKIVRLNSSYRPESLLNPVYGIFGDLFRIIGRRSLGKMYVADARCNGCGKCVRSCPAGAIMLSGRKPRWGLECARMPALHQQLPQQGNSDLDSSADRGTRAPDTLAGHLHRDLPPAIP